MTTWLFRSSVRQLPRPKEIVPTIPPRTTAATVVLNCLTIRGIVGLDACPSTSPTPVSRSMCRTGIVPTTSSNEHDERYIAGHAGITLHHERGPCSFRGEVLPS